MKKKIWKILLFVLIIALLSVALFFALKALGVTDKESLQAIIEKCGIWGNVVFVLLFVLVATLLCFVPATSATFIVVGTLIFPPWEAFLLCALSVFLSSSLMFFIGDKLGEKAVIRLVGKESLEKAQNLIDVKSKLFLPLMFLFPAFPDDALCMVAGLTKMKYWYFAIIVAIFRTVGVATFVFLGSGILPFNELNVIDWFVLVNVLIFDLILIFKYSDKLEKYIYRKRDEKHKVLLIDTQINSDLKNGEKVEIGENNLNGQGEIKSNEKNEDCQSCASDEIVICENDKTDEGCCNLQTSDDKKD
ncbi:MAG: TVP38/TMEM64 family protein [Christensenellales bacterium]